MGKLGLEKGQILRFFGTTPGFVPPIPNYEDYFEKSFIFWKPLLLGSLKKILNNIYNEKYSTTDSMKFDE